MSLDTVLSATKQILQEVGQLQRVNKGYDPAKLSWLYLGWHTRGRRVGLDEDEIGCNMRVQQSVFNPNTDSVIGV